MVALWAACSIGTRQVGVHGSPCLHRRMRAQPVAQRFIHPCLPAWASGAKGTQNVTLKANNHLRRGHAVLQLSCSCRQVIFISPVPDKSLDGGRIYKVKTMFIELTMIQVISFIE